MTLQQINEYLGRDFGYFEGTHPHWRVVWSNDQFEKRWTKFTPEGFELINPEVREVPKYRQWIHNKYVLERLLVIPNFVETDLIDKWSYEPIYHFDFGFTTEFSDTFYAACKFIVDIVYSASAKSVGVKYKDPDIGESAEETEEIRLKRLEGIEQELFGNETDISDAIAHKQAVVVPRNFETSAQVKE